MVSQVDAWRNQFGFLITSTVVRIELLSYPKLTQRDMKIIVDLLDTMYIVAVDDAIATVAAKMRRHYNLKLADSIIVGTALQTNTSLATRNTNDFRKVRELRLEAI